MPPPPGNRTSLAQDFVGLDKGIIREENTRGIASPKSSFQPFGMQHPLRRMVTPLFRNEPQSENKIRKTK